MSRFCFCNCPAGFSAEPERHAPDCPGRSGAGKARTPVPTTLTDSQSTDSGVDFGIDGRSVRVSQEAYSIFLAREAAGREKIAALQQRLTAADEREDHNTRVSAIEVEDVLLLQKRVDVLEGLLMSWLKDFGRTHSGLQRLKERTQAALKPAEGGGEPFCAICSGKKTVRMPGAEFVRDCPRCCHEEG